MCSISGSYDNDELQRLIKLNSHRGTHSHSILWYAPVNECMIDLVRGFGPPPSNINIPDDTYVLVHQQAPTTENRDVNSIHPAQLGKQLLWHNGIVKPLEIERLQNELQMDSSWDTMLLLKRLLNNPGEEGRGLSGIDGSFACVWYDGDGTLYAFRNEIAPLFYNGNHSISSTAFPGSLPLPAGKIWFLPEVADMVATNRYIRDSNFETVNNPYVFLDEL